MELLRVWQAGRLACAPVVQLPHPTSLQESSSSVLQTVATSADGAFSFGQVFPGDYLVRVGGSGGQKQRAAVQLSNAALEEPFRVG